MLVGTILYATMHDALIPMFEGMMEGYRRTNLESMIDFTSDLGAVPSEITIVHGNMFLNEGINALWSLVCGGAETSYSNANARLGVGDSTAGAAATQTALQAGANVLFKGMDATFPTFGTAQKATFKSTFASAEGNFAWQEWGIDNGATANKNLNRKVESLGTKSSGTTWTLSVDLNLA